MVSLIIGCALLALALLAVAFQRFYSCVPAKELKRLAARGDHLAAALYRPVAYGASLRLLLWVIVVLSLPLGFVLVAASLPPAAMFAVMTFVLTVAMVILPNLRLTVHSARFAVSIAPLLDKILSFGHPLLDKIAKVVGRYRGIDPHSRLYEKEDLVQLLEQQSTQPDNRLAKEEVDLIARAMHFSDKQAADIVTPRSRLRTLKTSDTLGPILLDELHQSGQRSFLVCEDKPESIVGTLLMKDAAEAKHGGRVGDLMRRQMCYVHEDFALPQVARAFAETAAFAAVVVNRFGECVGAITLAQLLQELIGDKGEALELSYEDAASVALYRPEPKLATTPEEETKAEEAAVQEAETTDAKLGLAGD